MYRGRIEFYRDDARHLEKALENINIKDRATGIIKTKGNRMVIEINAKDANAFRAALNSYLRIIQTTENIGGIE